MGQTTVGRKQVGVGEGMMALLAHLFWVLCTTCIEIDTKRLYNSKYLNNAIYLFFLVSMGTLEKKGYLKVTGFLMILGSSNFR